MTQQDNCICRVQIDNQIQPIAIGLWKYDGLSSSAPEETECGLAVDINHIPDMSTESVIVLIECINNVNYRTILLLPNSTLQFKWLMSTASPHSVSSGADDERPSYFHKPIAIGCIWLSICTLHIQLSCCVIIRNTTLSTLGPPEYVSSVAELALHISATVRM
jgi:hypothetical protein